MTAEPMNLKRVCTIKKVVNQKRGPYRIEKKKKKTFYQYTSNRELVSRVGKQLTK